MILFNAKFCSLTNPLIFNDFTISFFVRNTPLQTHGAINSRRGLNGNFEWTSPTIELTVINLQNTIES